MIDVAERVFGYSDEPWGLLVALWLPWLFVGAYAIVPASVLPVVTDELPIGLAAASWIVTAPQVGAAIAGLPAGVALDRVRNDRAIVLAGLLLIVAGVVGWVAGTGGAYWPLVGSRLAGGAALVTIWVAGTNVLSAGFSLRYRATAVAVYTTGYPAGYGLGQFAAPFLTARFGWPATFPVFSLLAVAAAGPCYLAARPVARRLAESTSTTGDRPAERETSAEHGASTEYGTSIEQGTPAEHETPTERSASVGRDLVAVVTSRAVWAVCIVSFLAYSLYMIFNSWMPTYLVEAFGLSLTESAPFVALLPAVGIVARAGGGVIADRAFDCRERPVVILSFVATTLVVAVLAVPAELGASGAFLAGMVAVGVSIQLQIGVLYTYVQAFVETGQVASAVALVSVVGWVGQFIAPAVTGALVDFTGSYATILGCGAAVCLCGTLAGWLAPEP